MCGPNAAQWFRANSCTAFSCTAERRTDRHQTRNPCHRAYSVLHKYLDVSAWPWGRAEASDAGQLRRRIPESPAPTPEEEWSPVRSCIRKSLRRVAEGNPSRAISRRRTGWQPRRSREFRAGLPPPLGKYPREAADRARVQPDLKNAFGPFRLVDHWERPRGTRIRAAPRRAVPRLANQGFVFSSDCSQFRHSTGKRNVDDIRHPEPIRCPRLCEPQA